MTREFHIDCPRGHQTLDGQKVRILCTDAIGYDKEKRLLVLLSRKDSADQIYWYTQEGLYLGQTNNQSFNLHLMDCPEPKVTFYIVFYKHPDVVGRKWQHYGAYTSEQSAKDMTAAWKYEIKIVPVEV